MASAPHAAAPHRLLPAVALGAMLAGALAAAVWLQRDEEAGATPQRAAAEAPGREHESRPGAASAELVAPAPPLVPGVVRWLAAGGGPWPDSNEVGIEAALEQVPGALGPNGWLLYAGGPGTRAVQELRARAAAVDPQARDALREGLAAFFWPRAGRDATYRQTRLEPRAAADAETLLINLETLAAAVDAEPLVVVLAGHGEAGQEPADALFLTWGGGAVGPGDLAASLERLGQHRRVVFLIGSCFSGGFAELIFRGAERAAGPAAGDRCALMAAPWDREASGCDSDPKRRAEGWTHKLLERVRAAPDEGLLASQGNVRAYSRTMDVPTTTSERWLREFAPPRGEREVPLAGVWPEEERVVLALAEATGLGVAGASVQSVLRRLGPMEDERGAIEASLGVADEEVARTFDAAAAAMLSRWPVLDDPWHPAFEETVDTHRIEIEAFLRTDATYAEYLRTEQAVRHLEVRLHGLLVSGTKLWRLLRGLENLELARRSKAEGGELWQGFERLLECERTVIGRGGRP